MESRGMGISPRDGRAREMKVERGDHVRLQDIRLGYEWSPKAKPYKIELFSYANNLAMLWKASDDPLDPDFRTMNPLRSLTLGLRLQY